jgi:hypothetical protein
MRMNFLAAGVIVKFIAKRPYAGAW